MKLVPAILAAVSSVFLCAQSPIVFSSGIETALDGFSKGAYLESNDTLAVLAFAPDGQVRDPMAFGQAAAPSCSYLRGAELVLANQSKPYVIVGERHGTNEIPVFFGDLVCAAASKGPVVVGLEIQTDQQKSLDQFMASGGDQAARDALLAHDHWRSQDGRASKAMFQMLENLRRLRQEGKQIFARALMPSADTPEAQEFAMGMAWKQSLHGYEKNAKLLMLVGSVHAERERLGRFIPAAQPSRFRGAFLFL